MTNKSAVVFQDHKISDKKNLPYIVSINISSGGVPKLPIDSIYVSCSGLKGDGHNHAKHDDPIQAVCLQDIEQLEGLNLKGHALAPGSTGENLTVKNLHINKLPLKAVLKFSGGVIVQLSKIRRPCYVMDAIHPRLKEDTIGCHGIYAKVIREGILAAGEMIDVILPSLPDKLIKTNTRP